MTGHQTDRTRTKPGRPNRRILRGTILTLLAAAVPLTAGTLTAGTAAADPTTSAWSRLRNCESGGNYRIIAVNGHYGAYQFDLATWRSVGGTGKPNTATPAEQNFRALYLYRMRGWQPWTCAHMLGLRPDRDAASHRAPTRAQAAYMGGGHTVIKTGTKPKPIKKPAPPKAKPVAHPAMPAWPGVVYAYGDCARALRTWQLRMNAFSFHFHGTGCYYNDTKAAVIAVQRANHINPSGRLGPQTWRAAWQGKAPSHATLQSAAVPAWPGVVYSYGDCAPALRAWQLRMNALGFQFDGTGCYLAKTKTAVIALQRANHINPSGRLGPQTWQAAWLGKAP